MTIYHELKLWPPAEEEETYYSFGSDSQAYASAADVVRVWTFSVLSQCTLCEPKVCADALDRWDRLHG